MDEGTSEDYLSGLREFLVGLYIEYGDREFSRNEAVKHKEGFSLYQPYPNYIDYAPDPSRYWIKTKAIELITGKTNEN